MWLSLDYEASRHGWRMEPAVEWEYSSLIRVDCYGCVVDWALVRRMRRDEDIVRVGGTHGEGMILISWVVEVDHQGVAPVNGDHAC